MLSTRTIVYSLTFIFFCSSFVKAQENNPFSLKWKQINTDHFNILFPTGYEKQGLRMANALEVLHAPGSATMGGKNRRVSVLLQNQSAVSNGFVTLAPWRSEFFGMPPQDYNFIGTNDWLDLLATHEYRHMVQFSRSITGINRLIYFLFGQNGVAVTSFAAAPQWFWEGDAVAMETALTNSGRGRIPSFNMLLRTNLQEGRVFNYSKQYLRSYKHNINDHYVLGYHMVSHLRKKTGQADIWERIATRAWRTPYIPFTFSRAIKKETGMNINELYRDMAATVTKEWQTFNASVDPTQREVISLRNSQAYVDYLYPQVQTDGSVIAWKKGIGDIDQLVLLSADSEEKIFTQGPVSISGQLSAAAGRIVWNEFRYDPRWQVKNYLVLMGYDLNTKKAKQITHKTRFASAALSPDGTKIASIETTVNYESSLVIVDWETGDVVKRFENPTNDAISMPRWQDGNTIVALRTASNRKTITRFDLTTGQTSDLYPPSEENVGHPVPAGKYIFYNSPWSGVDNIYALETETGTRFRVTASKYGAFNANVSPDGQWIYYNEQGRDGHDIVRTRFDVSAWQDVSREMFADPTAEALAQQEGHPDLLMTPATSREWAVKPYSRARGMFNAHSWGPYATSSLTNINFGIYSRDLLNTTSIDAGYQVDISERTGAWNAALSYQGFYPILDFSVTHGKRKTSSNFVVDNTLTNVQFDWKEQSAKAGVRIPLKLTSSKYSRAVEVKNSVVMTRASEFVNDYDGSGRVIDAGTFFSQLDNGTLLSNEFSFQFSNLLRRSRRDIQSKWGQILEFRTTGALVGSDFSGQVMSATGYFYFPGFVKHHSLFGIGAYQQNRVTFYPDNYWFRNQIPKPRGGMSYPTHEQFYFGSVNYTLPLWYPDIALGPFVNFQRVRANLFFDYGFGQTSVSNSVAVVSDSREYQSTGIEVRFDGNLMRLLEQFDLGFRYTYRLTDQTPFFELIIGGFGF